MSVVAVACSTTTTDTSATPDAPNTTVAQSSTTALDAPTVTLQPGADPILGVVAPKPTDHPFVKYSYRWVEYVAECAEAAGFVFQVIDTAAPHLSYAGPGSERAGQVLDRCETIAHTEGWVIPDPFNGSPEANGLLYDVFVGIHTCMVELGYPTTDPPSKEAFIEEGETLWTPWEEMFNSVFYVDPKEEMSSSGQLQYDAQEACGGLPNEVYDEQLQDQG